MPNPAQFAAIHRNFRHLLLDDAATPATIATGNSSGRREVTLFELVRIALDELYAEGKAALGSKVDARIAEQMAYLSDSYGKLNQANREKVSYKDPATRFAYAYKYVATHGDYIVQILEEFRNHLDEPIFKNETARVSCIGGGPGSDVIGLLKYLEDQGPLELVKKVICYLLDQEQAWADTWTEIDDSLKVGISLHPAFQPLDVTKPASWESQRKFLQADLFTLSYFVSEVISLDKNGIVSAFWKRIFEESKPGALFLYIDNGHTDFNAYFDELWKGAGLKKLIGKSNVRMIPHFSEQASELAAYQHKFGQFPKIQSYVSYRVLRKPSK